LGPIAQRQNELRGNEERTDVAQDGEYDAADVVPKGIDSRISQATGDEVEGEVEVGEGEEGEEELDKLIDGLDVEEDLAGEGMICR
jgi:hypothetical protein